MALEVGAQAPDFTLRDQHGQPMSLVDLHGGAALVLVFYPFAFSRVCTAELGDLQHNLARFADLGAGLAAVSCDPVYAVRAYADQDGLGFPLLSDFWPHGAVASAFGVFDEQRGCATRSTFVLDRRAAVRWSVHHPMPEARDVEEYLRVLAGLREDRRTV